MKWAKKFESCRHPVKNRYTGKRIPVRFGTFATERCSACGGYRTTSHGFSIWRSNAELQRYLKEDDEG